MCGKNNKNKQSNKQSAGKSASDNIKDAINAAFALKGEIGLKFAKKEISAGDLNKQLDEIDALIARLKSTLSDMKQHETVTSTIASAVICPASCSVSCCVSASSVRYDAYNTDKIKVGDSVRIVGPSISGGTGMIGRRVKITHIDSVGDCWTKPNLLGHIFPASSVVLASKVPAPKFKVGDEVACFKVLHGSFKIVDIKWSSECLSWFYCGESCIWTRESSLKPVLKPVIKEYLPTYLPTRYINIGRKEYESLLWRASPAISTVAKVGNVQIWNTHVIYDMPAGPDGRQVHILDLINAGYTFYKSSIGKFQWNYKGEKYYGNNEAIDVVRSAAEHYLLNIEKNKR